MGSMQVFAVDQPGPIAAHPLLGERRPIPTPREDQVLVQVRACGVCRTDLHLAEADLPPRRRGVVPGHEAVGVVVQRGVNAKRFEVGERIGIAWLRETCGSCQFCRTGRENLCVHSRYTGWDADGGYAEFALVREDFAYRIPVGIDDVAAAPLLCSGIIGYRALRRAQVPPGGRLGIYGFGASAQLTAQLATRQGVEVHVITRGLRARKLALDLGAAWADDGKPPEPLDAAILFAPAGELVPAALAALAPGGTLAIAGVYLTDIPAMIYAEHVFQERTLTSVTSNTRRDGEEFLLVSSRLAVRPRLRVLPLAEASRALRDLALGDVDRATVLVP